ncbi:MAG TPA: hypothetical protein VFS51_01635 [Gemmatimonadales bacterium]|nr:hypothetical protein [Gemmatimonadales bacterium]
MLKEAPDHHDADLVLKLYDLRREVGMRESRNAINSKFWPRNAEEALAVTAHDHPLNDAFRQTAEYWEMVYGMARHGIIHCDFLVENNGEGLFLFARVEPYLDQLRKGGSARAFRNAEWVVIHCGTAQSLMEGYRARIKRVLESGR